MEKLYNNVYVNRLERKLKEMLILIGDIEEVLNILDDMNLDINTECLLDNLLKSLPSEECDDLLEHIQEEKIYQLGEDD
jgi:hypothetical protein